MPSSFCSQIQPLYCWVTQCIISTSFEDSSPWSTQLGGGAFASSPLHACFSWLHQEHTAMRGPASTKLHRTSLCSLATSEQRKAVIALPYVCTMYPALDTFRPGGKSMDTGGTNIHREGKKGKKRNAHLPPIMWNSWGILTSAEMRGCVESCTYVELCCTPSTYVGTARMCGRLSMRPWSVCRVPTRYNTLFWWGLVHNGCLADTYVCRKVREIPIGPWYPRPIDHSGCNAQRRINGLLPLRNTTYLLWTGSRVYITYHISCDLKVPHNFLTMTLQNTLQIDNSPCILEYLVPLHVGKI